MLRVMWSGAAVLQGDILEDIPLIENLEETKRTAVQIAEQVKAAKVGGQGVVLRVLGLGLCRIPAGTVG